MKIKFYSRTLHSDPDHLIRLRPLLALLYSSGESARLRPPDHGNKLRAALVAEKRHRKLPSGGAFDPLAWVGLSLDVARSGHFF